MIFFNWPFMVVVLVALGSGALRFAGFISLGEQLNAALLVLILQVLLYKV